MEPLEPLDHFREDFPSSNLGKSLYYNHNSFIVFKSFFLFREKFIKILHKNTTLTPNVEGQHVY
jgi:hypothetical protein